MAAKTIKHHADGTQEILDENDQTVGFFHKGVLVPLTTLKAFKEYQEMPTVVGFDMLEFARDPEDGAVCVVPVLDGRMLINAVGSNETEAAGSLSLLDLEDDEFNRVEYRKARIVLE